MNHITFAIEDIFIVKLKNKKMEKKNLRKNSKEVKYVYNYIIEDLKEKQKRGDGNAYIFRFEYELRYLFGNGNLEFMYNPSKYGIDLDQFWNKLFEYDSENYDIIESVKWGFFNNKYYEITLTDIIQYLNLKK